MSKLLNSDDFGKRLYNTLPEIYRTEDVYVDYALKRFLLSLSEGGFSKVIDEINGLTYLLDPERVPAEVLPIAFRHYGLEIFNGIPEAFLRKLLPMISELYKRKGTITAIEYLTSIISGVKAVVEVDPDFNENYGIDVRLEMDYGDHSKELPDRDQLLRIIEEFVPFFCDVTIVYVYLFYEWGKLQADDTEDTIRVKELFATESGILVSNQTGLSLSTNILDVLLNESLYLNDTYYYDYVADWYKDVINTVYKEVCNITRTFSKQYRETLNEVTHTLNGEFVLNEFLETDYHEDVISYNVVTELGRTEFVDFLVTKIHNSYHEKAGIYAKGLPVPNTAVFGEAVFAEAIFGTDNNHVDTRHDDVFETRYETGSISTELSKEMKPVLNMDYSQLNVSLYLNRIAKVDECVDVPHFIPLEDKAVLRKEAEDKVDHLIQSNPMLWSLNSDRTLNGDFLIGEYAMTDIANLAVDENSKMRLNRKEVDYGNLAEPIDTFTNRGYNTLNTTFYLNVMSVVDKWIIGGETRYIVPLETGNITL